MEYNLHEVNGLSGTTEAQRATNFRWLAAQGEQTKIEAAKMQTDLIRQHRKSNPGRAMSAEFAYAMHAMALVKMIWMETAQKRKGDRLSDQEFAKVQDIRIDRIKAKKRKKSSPKKDLIRVRFFHLIQDLRQKNLSWREIADYLHTHNKIKLTHSYIRETFLELSTEREMVGA